MTSFLENHVFCQSQEAIMLSQGVDFAEEVAALLQQVRSQKTEARNAQGACLILEPVAWGLKQPAIYAHPAGDGTEYI